MNKRRSGWAAMVLLWPMTGQALEPPERTWHSLARLEATALTLWPRTGEEEAEGFAQVEPTLIIDGGSEFGVSVGAPVRFRVQRGREDSSLLRREDWDSLSDWGQLVRGLKFGSDRAPLRVWLGGFDGFTLLSGHLVRRYSNRAHPDEHPAGGFLAGTLGPLYTQAFTSDVLSARLMGAEVALDVAHVFWGRPREPGRYTLALSVVHDWDRAASVTLGHVDATAVVVVRPGFEAHVLAGWGWRPGARGAWGAVVGVGADALTSRLDAKLRLELRRQVGDFRQGFFGPDYELARLQAPGPEGRPLAEVTLPQGYSAFGEVEVGWDAESYGGTHRHLELSLGVEGFSWGRVDVDGRLSVQLFERGLEVALRCLSMGLGQPGARYQGGAEVRWRFLGGGVYVLGTGGSRLFPNPEGGLGPRAFASVGLGVDHAR
ncbi:hypothetical protein MYSTI_00180 [Myxococcus stipitatus DSM 14675]|uniref:Uncharacterized protein n=1 Tax=Myxococcus stipitatus (strain DSM 14675 / JCM 12634 / Mx s8) TaxID=1278073 RepID=L7U4V8_MYXSD|nr:hypothetical protein [Myxococcus stipitatus]AGC41539.1 hypothetical protein MYSTI_00180 [Myxococcus stipitatus DSM 14675]